MKTSDPRTLHFAASVGIPQEVARIFTSRIQDDETCYEVLDMVYNLCHACNLEAPQYQTFWQEYKDEVEKIKLHLQTKALPSLEIFLLERILKEELEKTSIKIEDLSQQEIVILYDWLIP